MAIKHILALDIPDTACDTILKIWDSSSYAETLPVDCPRLDIFFPGFFGHIRSFGSKPSF